ncbi:MAG: transcriptional regulator [Clostridia bacterium]|nr:transcriptional regulator [Clostridia bacterium]
MASSKEFKNYILEQLRLLGSIDCRPMMGEFLLYYQGKLFGGIYDNRLLVKRTATNEQFHLTAVVPYPNAKPMYMVDNLDDMEMLQQVILATSQGL